MAHVMLGQWTGISTRFALFLCLALLQITPCASSGQQTQAQKDDPASETTTLPASQSLSPDRLFALASPAVVKLIVKDEDDREIANASGFLVASQRAKSDVSGQAIYDSTVITNYHVIRPAVSVDVMFPNGQKGWVSEVVSEDESGDIAVLTVHSLMKPTRTLRLHEGSNPPVGTRVYTIGSPQGLGNTLSEGLISGYRELGQHAPWIQITAPISPGSSGGPLLSTEGTVLGISTATIKEGQNLNFAIPAREVQQRLNARKTARAVWEGASIRKTTEHAFAKARVVLYLPCWEASIKTVHRSPMTNGPQ